MADEVTRSELGETVGLLLGLAVCAALVVVLLPLAFISLLVVTQTWQGAAGLALGVALVAAVVHFGLPGATLLAAAAAGAILAVVGGMVASRWDLEGKWEDGTITAAEQVVLVVTLVGGVAGLVLGVAAAIRARSWAARIGGLATANVAAFMVAGLAFL